MMSESVMIEVWGEHNTRIEFYYLKEFGSQSVLHREDGPAVIEYNGETNEVECNIYYRHGVMHRLDGPAYERFNLYPKSDMDGAVKVDDWYRVHGDELPLAVLQAHASGVITDEQLKEIQAKVSEAEQLITFAEALERNDG